jgi:hypothetical protein
VTAVWVVTSAGSGTCAQRFKWPSRTGCGNRAPVKRCSGQRMAHSSWSRRQNTCTTRCFRPSRTGRQRRGKWLGGQLLLAAGRRCLMVSAEVGGVALLIDATNARVAAWYATYGAVPMLDAPLSLVLPLRTIEASLRAAGKY